MTSTFIQPVRSLCLFWILAFCGFSSYAEEPAYLDIHLDARGNDQQDGSAAKPVATLAKARDLQRAQPAEKSKRIVVHAGKYFNTSVTLGLEDNGLTIEAAPNEKPVLYGGVPLTNWVKDGENVYAATLPEIPGITWDVRMLQVDERLCPRARYPEKGTLLHLTVFDVPWMSSTGGGWKRKPTHEELSTLKYKAGDLGPWLDLKNAEITVFHMWDDSCVGVTVHDTEKQILTLKPDTGHPPGAFGVKKYVAWNIREGLKAPGQWYFDRSNNRIVYWPLPGQDMMKVEVIVPTTTAILRLIGTREKPIKNITVRGLGISVTTVPLITGGFAADALGGAVALENTEHCTLSNLSILRVAGHGIKGGTIGTRVEECEVGSCGAGGIYVGGSKSTIYGNHVHDVGLAYPSSIGIFKGGTENVVNHNEVHGCSYSGINYGGNGNIIENNEIYDCMRDLHDGAAIYLFGAKNCIVRGNYAHDITDSGGYGASAYYLDEQSENCVVENNLSVRVNWPSHNHMAKGNALRNNVFVADGDMKLTFPRSSDYTFTWNLLYTPGKITIEGIQAVSGCSENLFFSGKNKLEFNTQKDYAKAGTLPDAPQGITIGDPLFLDAAKGDFRFKPDSPALKLGIVPLDMSKVGRPKKAP